MDKPIWALVAIFILFAGAAQGQHVAGELVLRAAPGTTPAALRRAARREGARSHGELPEMGLLRVQVPEPALPHVRTALAARPEVAWVERNAVFAPEALPDDPRYGDAWHLARLGLPASWDTSTGAGISIAILDSGVDPDHPDLTGKLEPGTSTYDGGDDWSDVFGHGTRVAGSAAADTGNALGVSAVGWDATILPVRVTGSDGWATAWAIAQGLDFAAGRGARVANLSFAGLGSSATVLTAAQDFVDRGGVVVAAAGNCGCTESTPDSAALLTVGATDAADALASFSSRGDHVDVAAPGTAILSTTNGGNYASGSGTSFAAPVVSGVVALLLAADPALAAADVEQLLASTAVDLGATGWDPGFGHGRVDAAAAVLAAGEGVPAPGDTVPPQISIVSPADGATLGGSATVVCDAQDDGGVAEVELLLDGTPIAVDTSAPYDFPWDTTGVADGIHALQASARDLAGNTTTTPLTTVAVENLATDTSPPAVRVVAPSDGSTLGKTTYVDVAADDDVVVARLDIRVNGWPIATTECSSQSCALRFRWNTRRLETGTYTITAAAQDASGNESTSVEVEVVKEAGSGGGPGRGNNKGGGRR